MNEFMGLIHGMYEAKQDGFLPGKQGRAQTHYGLLCLLQSGITDGVCMHAVLNISAHTQSIYDPPQDIVAGGGHCRAAEKPSTMPVPLVALDFGLHPSLPPPAGGASLHLCMTPHGPDTATYESAILPTAETPAHLGRKTLAFMFETSLTPRVTPAALGSPCIDRDYYKCWLGLKSHFDRDWYSKQQQQQVAKPGAEANGGGGAGGAAAEQAAAAAAAADVVDAGARC